MVRAEPEYEHHHTPPHKKTLVKKILIPPKKAIVESWKKPYTPPRYGGFLNMMAHVIHTLATSPLQSLV
jgi:hypothetical protein